MGSGGSAKPSFQFNDKQALALNQQNVTQLQQYQLQRQGLLSGQNQSMANYFNNTNQLAQNSMLMNMSAYTNALGGYQNSLNQNTADANSLLAQQNAYYNQVLGQQQQYQNSFANLMGETDAKAAAKNAEYQQNYLNRMGQYNQDNTAQQQNFIQDYLAQMGAYSAENQAQQDKYQKGYLDTKSMMSQIQQQAAAQQAALMQQQEQQNLGGFLSQWGQRRPVLQGYNPQVGLGASFLNQAFQQQLQQQQGQGNLPSSAGNRFPQSRNPRY